MTASRFCVHWHANGGERRGSEKPTTESISRNLSGNYRKLPHKSWASWIFGEFSIELRNGMCAALHHFGRMARRRTIDRLIVKCDESLLTWCTNPWKYRTFPAANRTHWRRRRWRRRPVVVFGICSSAPAAHFSVKAATDMPIL